MATARMETVIRYLRRAVRRLVELLRLQAGARCFARYRRELNLDGKLNGKLTCS